MEADGGGEGDGGVPWTIWLRSACRATLPRPLGVGHARRPVGAASESLKRTWKRSSLDENHSVAGEQLE